jgi:hypothetical protein
MDIIANNHLIAGLKSGENPNQPGFVAQPGWEHIYERGGAAYWDRLFFWNGRGRQLFKSSWREFLPKGATYVLSVSKLPPYGCDCGARGRCGECTCPEDLPKYVLNISHWLNGEGWLYVWGSAIPRNTRRAIRAWAAGLPTGSELAEAVGQLLPEWLDD